MKLGILKTDAVRPEWVPEFGEYPDQFMVLLSRVDPELAYAVYDVQQGEYPADIDEVDAYLMTGSKSSVYEEEQWIADLIEFTRELHARQKKIIGICFGHQLVAHALGGRTGKSPKGWGVGLHTHTFNRQPGWHDGDLDLDILVSHQDQVIDVATGAEVLASSDFCEHAVTQLGEHVLTFQGHPEFIPEYASAIMNVRRDIIGESAYTNGMDSLSGRHEGDRVARWIHAFLNA